MFHGASAWELRTVAVYARRHPQVIFNIDSHADAVNSGHGFLSRDILHRRFYAPILRNAMKYTKKLLCVSTSVMEFAEQVYNIPTDRMEFYPLGGRIINAETRLQHRGAVRNQLGVDDKTILIVQSGKQNRLKRLPQALTAFSRVRNPDLRLVIAGVLQDDVRVICETLIAKDPRVMFLGWQDSESLTQLLCAADVYLQPGTQSATMQHSICCGCAVILDRIPAHQPYMVGNGWLVGTEAELEAVLENLTLSDLESAKAASVAFAAQTLDYSALSARLFK
jgi:hypothetical protein